jgi:hypothetical protein
MDEIRLALKLPKVATRATVLETTLRVCGDHLNRSAKLAALVNHGQEQPEPQLQAQEASTTNTIKAEEYLGASASPTSAFCIRNFP